MHRTTIVLCSLLFSCATGGTNRGVYPQAPVWASLSKDHQSASGVPARDSGRRPKTYFRGGAYVGFSENEDELGDTLDGSAFGGRVEVGGILHPQFELGGRFSLGGQETDNTFSGALIETSTLDFIIEPVFRGYFSSANSRPYAEVFVGYMTSDIDFTTPSAAISGDADGVSYGFGAGIEFGLQDNSAITLGGEFRLTDLDVSVGGLSGDFDRTDILGTLTFVTRW